MNQSYEVARKMPYLEALMMLDLFRNENHLKPIDKADKDTITLEAAASEFERIWNHKLTAKRPMQ